jgi:hypothetical protein
MFPEGMENCRYVSVPHECDESVTVGTMAPGGMPPQINDVSMPAGIPKLPGHPSDTPGPVVGAEGDSELGEEAGVFGPFGEAEELFSVAGPEAPAPPVVVVHPANVTAAQSITAAVCHRGRLLLAATPALLRSCRPYHALRTLFPFHIEAKSWQSQAVSPAGWFLSSSLSFSVEAAQPRPGHAAADSMRFSAPDRPAPGRRARENPPGRRCA